MLDSNDQSLYAYYPSMGARVAAVSVDGTETVILAINSDRNGLTLFNLGSKLYVKLGLGASLAWLKEVNQLESAIDDMKESSYKEHISNISDAEYREEQRRVASIVKQKWREIEDTFLPKRQKYG